MLSSDVSAGFDPGYAGKFETKNAAFMGRGLCFNKYHRACMDRTATPESMTFIPYLAMM